MTQSTPDYWCEICNAGAEGCTHPLESGEEAIPRFCYLCGLRFMGTTQISVNHMQANHPGWDTPDV